MISEHNLVKIGKIIKSHGIYGKVLCEFYVDYDKNIVPQYFIIEEEGILVPFFINNFQKKSAFAAFVTFDGINNEKSAKLICSKDIFTDKNIVTDTDTGDIFIDFLIGFKIVDKNYGEIGKITDIDNSTINTLFVVEDRLIPAQKEFIISIDKKKKIIFTDLPDGLLEL